MNEETVRRLARQPIYDGIDPARRDDIRRARRTLALLRRLGKGGADPEALSLILQQDSYARTWEAMELWPGDDEPD